MKRAVAIAVAAASAALLYSLVLLYYDGRSDRDAVLNNFALPNGWELVSNYSRGGRLTLIVDHSGPRTRRIFSAPIDTDCAHVRAWAESLSDAPASDLIQEGRVGPDQVACAWGTTVGTTWRARLLNEHRYGLRVYIFKAEYGGHGVPEGRVRAELILTGKKGFW